MKKIVITCPKCKEKMRIMDKVAKYSRLHCTQKENQKASIYLPAYASLLLATSQL